MIVFSDIEVNLHNYMVNRSEFRAENFAEIFT